MPRSNHSDPYAALVNALVKARRSAGLRQIDVAERLGKPQSFVSKVEKRERHLGVIELIAMAHAIGVGPTELIAVPETMLRERCSI